MTKGKSAQLFQYRDEVTLTDFLQTQDHLHLDHLIHRIDVVNPFLLVPVALMNRIDAEIAGFPVRPVCSPMESFPDGGAAAGQVVQMGTEIEARRWYACSSNTIGPKSFFMTLGVLWRMSMVTSKRMSSS